MGKNIIFGIEIIDQNKKDILEKIVKNILRPLDFFHVVSLNPEIFVIASKDPYFKKVVRKAQIRIIDGAGVNLALRILGLQPQKRTPGVGLMKELFKLAQDRSLRVMLIGGRPNLAETIAKCQNDIQGKKLFYGLEGIEDISKPDKDEEKRIFSIITDMKPHLIFVAFGSPYQEVWLYKNRAQFKKCVCMGVGGGFDFVGGVIDRAPKFMRDYGFEWLYRALKQPWRIIRQLRFFSFMVLVTKEFLTKGK